MIGISRDVAALRDYHYASSSDSLLYPLFKRLLYRPLLEVTPRGIPANAITLFAFVLALLSSAATIAFGVWPSRALPIIAGLALFGYGTLDNIDGAQARRNGTNGPIGELLDHGTDSIVMFSIPLCFAVLWASPAVTVLAVAVGVTAFFASMWAHQQTGALPTGPVADVECVALVSSFFIAIGIAGADWLVAPIFAGAPSPTALIIAAGCLGSAGQIVVCTRAIPPGARASTLARFFAPQALFVAWFWAAGGATGGGAIGLAMGIAGSRAAIGAILARVHRAPLRAFDPISAAVAAIGVACALGGVGHEREIAWAAAIGLTVDMVVRAVIEVRAIARATGRRVFAANA